MRTFLHCAGALLLFIGTVVLFQAAAGGEVRAARERLDRLDQQLVWGRSLAGKTEELQREIDGLKLKNRQLETLMIREDFRELRREHPRHSCFQGSENLLPPPE